MRKILLSALFATAIALPAAAQPTWRLGGVLIEPRHSTTSDRIRLTVVGEGQCYEFKPVYDEASRSVVVNLEPQDCISVVSYHPIRETFEIGPLPAGRHFVEILVGDDAFGVIRRTPFEVREASPAIRLGKASEDYFDIKVSYRIPGEAHFSVAPGVPLTRDSAYFYFFDRENVEVTAKVLDGRGVNGHWWVFLASMTTVELEIEVTRCPPDGLPVPCVTKTYVQPAGQNRNFLDTSTF